MSVLEIVCEDDWHNDTWWQPRLMAMCRGRGPPVFNRLLGVPDWQLSSEPAPGHTRAGARGSRGWARTTDCQGKMPGEPVLRMMMRVCFQFCFV